MHVLKISTVRSLCTLCTVCTLLLLVPASCVREDMEECTQYALNVRAVDNEGNDLTDSGVLQKADVYLFNENGFVRMVPSGISSDFLFGHDKRQKLTLVAWGNIKKDQNSVPIPSPHFSRWHRRRNPSLSCHPDGWSHLCL